MNCYFKNSIFRLWGEVKGNLNAGGGLLQRVSGGVSHGRLAGGRQRARPDGGAAGQPAEKWAPCKSKTKTKTKTDSKAAGRSVLSTRAMVLPSLRTFSKVFTDRRHSSDTVTLEAGHDADQIRNKVSDRRSREAGVPATGEWGCQSGCSSPVVSRSKNRRRIPKCVPKVTQRS